MKKRYLSLIAGIVTIVLDVFFIIQEVKSIKSVISSAWSGSGTAVDDVLIFVVVFSAFLALYSIFANFRMALYFTYSHKTYMSKMKRVYRAIFTNVLVAGLIIFGMTKEYTLLSLFTAIFSLVAAACITVDLVLEKKRDTALAVEGNKSGTAAETTTATGETTPVAEDTAAVNEETTATAEEPNSVAEETTASTEENPEAKANKEKPEELAETEQADKPAEKREKTFLAKKKKTSK